MKNFLYLCLVGTALVGVSGTAFSWTAAEIAAMSQGRTTLVSDATIAKAASDATSSAVNSASRATEAATSTASNSNMVYTFKGIHDATETRAYTATEYMNSQNLSGAAETTNTFNLGDGVTTTVSGPASNPSTFVATTTDTGTGTSVTPVVSGGVKINTSSMQLNGYTSSGEEVYLDLDTGKNYLTDGSQWNGSVFPDPDTAAGVLDGYDMDSPTYDSVADIDYASVYGEGSPEALAAAGGNASTTVGNNTSSGGATAGKAVKSVSGGVTTYTDGSKSWLSGEQTITVDPDGNVSIAPTPAGGAGSSVTANVAGGEVSVLPSGEKVSIENGEIAITGGSDQYTIGVGDDFDGSIGTYEGINETGNKVYDVGGNKVEVEDGKVASITPKTTPSSVEQKVNANTDMSKAEVDKAGTAAAVPIDKAIIFNVAEYALQILQAYEGMHQDDATKEITIKGAQSLQNSQGSASDSSVGSDTSLEATTISSAANTMVTLLKNNPMYPDYLDESNCASYGDEETTSYKECMQGQRKLFANTVALSGQMISEGSNAISAKFTDRIKQFSSTNNNLGTGSLGAMSVINDAERYPYFEMVRGTALSAVQLGVKESGTLFELDILEKEAANAQ